MNRSAFAVIAMVALVVHSIDARAIDVHWAYVPPQRPALPVVQHGEQVRNPIDRFVLAKLEGAGLGFAPRAELRQLARREHLT